MLRCEAWQKYSDPPAWTKQYQITPGEFSAPLSPAACAPESFQDVSLDWRTRGVMWIKGQRGVKLGTPTWPLQGHEWSTNCPAPPLIIWEHGSSILNEHHRSRPHRIKTLDWSGIWVECLDDISVVISRITDAAPCLEVTHDQKITSLITGNRCLAVTTHGDRVWPSSGLHHRIKLIQSPPNWQRPL